MNMLTIAFTSAKRMPSPDPLPEIVETPRQAFLAGWWGGIGVGLITGACCMYLLLVLIGRAQ